jgi:hypothetical protein
MNSHTEHPQRSNRPIAIFFTIVLQLGLAYYLYQQAVQTPDAFRQGTRTEQVKTTP